MGALLFLLLGNLFLQLGALACFVALVAEMFSHEETGWGIACIILLFCGCGQLLALVYGWTKAGEWDISLLMLANTACVVAGMIQVALWFAKLGPSMGM